MFDEDEEKTPIGPTVITICGWFALVVGTWGLISSTVAFYSAAGASLGLLSFDDVHRVRDLFGAPTVSVATYLILFYRIVLSSGVLIGSTWLLKLESRGRSLVSTLFAADVLMILITIAAWYVLSVQPRQEVLTIEVTLAVLRILVIITLAHPSLNQCLVQRNLPQSENDF